MKAITKQLQEIEDILNTNEEYVEEFWIYKLELNGNKITVNIFDGEIFQESIVVEIIEIGKIAICNTIKNYIYQDKINPRQKFVNETRNFNTRKIESMANWSKKDNCERVNRINTELIERSKKTKEIKSQLSFYRSYVSDFYKILSVEG
ncbi:hypothetical protein [Clostridium estertheticum]|uniref:Uncharacterized protein n=1 Tax=Clostridium estertheticum TaxID=238834 RepID=A0AA47EIM9_9CLOT|nr:hypothetical protein [Clostridium estertheticum]MBU3153484.1 hypothetical protein [Clostridium estertheticum]WAG60886.1 hypothetical protein LL038_01140 [Clostridium estertheticum]